MSGSEVKGSDSQVYYEKCVLKNFLNFSEKHLCICIFFKKAAGLKSATFEKRLLYTGA